jgi:putative ABC transport system permease protein
MVVGAEPGQPGAPSYLIAGRHITCNHYEAVANVKTGFKVGDYIKIRRHEYTVVGLTQRMVSFGAEPHRGAGPAGGSDGSPKQRPCPLSVRPL